MKRAQQNLFLIGLILFSAFILSACGGGNDANDQSNTLSETFTIDWCKLQLPTTIDATTNTDYSVYARLYIAGLTDMSLANDTHVQVIAQVGYGVSGSTPSTASWTWFDGIANASWDSTDAGESQNDEYVASLTTPSTAGTYSYTFRFSGNNGISWSYCDIDGTENGYDVNNNGIMTVSSVLAGFGAISGQVNNVTATEIDSPLPYLFRNNIDFFDNPYDITDYNSLSVGAQKIITDDSSGASGILAEALAYDILYRSDKATLLKSQLEIVYQYPGSITDFLIEIDGRKVGVSSTRAFSFPYTDPYTLSAAQTLISNKLQNILESTANVAVTDSWNKQILHVFAYSASHADLLETAWGSTDSALKTDTILMITITDGSDSFLYQ